MNQLCLHWSGAPHRAADGHTLVVNGPLARIVASLSARSQVPFLVVRPDGSEPARARQILRSRYA